MKAGVLRLVALLTSIVLVACASGPGQPPLRDHDYPAC